MFCLSVPLTLLSLCLLPLFLWLTVKVGRARREVASSTQKTMADMTVGDRGDAQRQRDPAVEGVRASGL